MQRGGRPSLSASPVAPQQQLGLFQAVETHPVLDRVRTLELDRLTPLEALNLLAELKRDAQ